MEENILEIQKAILKIWEIKDGVEFLPLDCKKEKTISTTLDNALEYLHHARRILCEVSDGE